MQRNVIFVGLNQSILLHPRMHELLLQGVGIGVVFRQNQAKLVRVQADNLPYSGLDFTGETPLLRTFCRRPPEFRHHHFNEQPNYQNRSLHLARCGRVRDLNLWMRDFPRRRFFTRRGCGFRTLAAGARRQHMGALVGIDPLFGEPPPYDRPP